MKIVTVTETKDVIRLPVHLMKTVIIYRTTFFKKLHKGCNNYSTKSIKIKMIADNFMLIS